MVWKLDWIRIWGILWIFFLSGQLWLTLVAKINLVTYYVNALKRNRKIFLGVKEVIIL